MTKIDGLVFEPDTKINKDLVVPLEPTTLELPNELPKDTRPIIVNVPFDDARTFLTKHKNSDVESAGDAPITLRWLNSKNNYVNIGVDKNLKGDKTFIDINNNSYGVTIHDLSEVADVLRKEFKL